MVSRFSAFSFICLAILIHFSPAKATEPSEATILVMDVSGSMWARMEGRTRIEVARDVLKDFLPNATRTAR